MSFAAPNFLAALGLLVPIAIAFLFRQRRRIVKVPSTMVFRMGLRSVVRNRKIRNLRRLIAFALCALGVALLVVAAARPNVRPRGEATVFVVDVSATMAGGSLADARRYLVREIAGVGAKDDVAIVTAGADARIVYPPAPPGPLLDRAIAALAAEPASAAMDEALALAESLRTSDHTRIIVLSDAPVDARKTTTHATARVFPKAERNNLGIVGMFTRTSPAARDDEEREAVVTIATSSDVARRARLTVTHEGIVLAEREVSLAAHGEIEQRVGLRGGGRVVARVRAVDGIADAVEMDDEASLLELARKPLRIALVREEGSVGAFFVEQAVQAAKLGTVVAVAPGDARPEADVAVVMRDGSARPANVPALFVGVEPPELGIAAHALMPNELKLRSVATNDSLMRGVALDETSIAGAKAASAPRGARVLCELDGGPVLLAGGTGRDSWIWMGIDPAASDVVLRVAFPVFVGNALAQLGGATRVVVATTVPRSESTLATREVAAPLPSAPEPRWRVPVAPTMLLAIVGALLLAIEAWVSLGSKLRDRATRRTA